MATWWRQVNTIEMSLLLTVSTDLYASLSLRRQVDYDTFQNVILFSDAAPYNYKKSPKTSTVDTDRPDTLTHGQSQ